MYALKYFILLCPLPLQFRIDDFLHDFEKMDENQNPETRIVHRGLGKELKDCILDDNNTGFSVLS